MVSFKWHPGHVTILRKLWADGMTGQAIGDLVGCGRGAVIGKASRLGLATRVLPKARRPVAADIQYGRARKCAWPEGDPREPGFYFCEEPTQAGSSYCPTHFARSRKKQEKPE